MFYIYRYQSLKLHETSIRGIKKIAFSLLKYILIYCFFLFNFKFWICGVVSKFILVYHCYYDKFLERSHALAVVSALLLFNFKECFLRSWPQIIEGFVGDNGLDINHLNFPAHHILVFCLHVVERWVCVICIV